MNKTEVKQEKKLLEKIGEVPFNISLDVLAITINNTTIMFQSAFALESNKIVANSLAVAVSFTSNDITTQKFVLNGVYKTTEPFKGKLVYIR